MRSVAVVAASTREQVVLTAERLFADHGVDGVSLRQIATGAGSANNSVVRYHFGSKEQLVQAVFEYRLPRLHARRLLLLDERRPGDLRGYVECQLRAVLEQSELDGSHYMSFVAMLLQHNQDLLVHVPDEVHAATGTFMDRLGSYLTHIIEPLRSRRLAQAMALIVHAAADRERARLEAGPCFPLPSSWATCSTAWWDFSERPSQPRLSRPSKLRTWPR